MLIHCHTTIALHFVAFTFISLNSFGQQDTLSAKQPKKSISLAEVNKVEGLLIFTDCKPVEEFEVLGKINTVQMGADYEGTRDALITKVKKKHPNADGIIYHPYDRYGVPFVEAINFKEQ